MGEMDRRAYAAEYGPTAGDRVRLADTDLWVQVEADHVGYGDEPLFGFGKTVRSRLLQDDRSSDSALDFVILGVLLVDPVCWGCSRRTSGSRTVGSRVSGCSTAGRRTVLMSS